MKKIIVLFFIMPFFSFCGTEQSNVKRIIEDEVEIVLNQIEPYTL